MRPPDDVHPDLRRHSRLLPRTITTRRSLPLLRRLTRLIRDSDAPRVALPEGASALVYRPPRTTPGPAVLWIHGGGLVLGTATQDDGICRRFSRELDAVVASVDYRLAPEHPYPAALDDCYAALTWLAEQPDVDPARIAIAGASAGGGLAAALALLAHERGAVLPAFQLLVYPMLDDRTSLRTDLDDTVLRLWSRRSNDFGWRSYTGHPAGAAAVPALAAPARATDLSGLPPAWIGVGTHDLFHDEDVEHAGRLAAAGVACELEIVPGAFHGFDGFAPKAGVSRVFAAAQVAALKAALGPS